MSGLPPPASTIGLTNIGETTQTALDGSFPADFDACRRRLESADIPAQERARVYCRLSEALYHKGSRDEAVECARMAFALQPADEEVANLSAWVFSNSQRHEEAGAAYESLLALRPGWAEGHRHASGSFAVAGDIERAIFHGTSASCECYEGCSPGVGLGNCWLPTIGNP